MLPHFLEKDRMEEFKLYSVVFGKLSLLYTDVFAKRNGLSDRWREQGN